MKLLSLFMMVSLAIAQMDYSVYEDVTYIKTNSVPDEIQSCLNVSDELNYKEIKNLSYPENIIRETNILTHLYDNFWQTYLSNGQKNVVEICKVGGADFFEHINYMVKLHRQFLKNVEHIAKDGKCRVCDPMAYWFRLKLEAYKTPWKDYSPGGGWSNEYPYRRKIGQNFVNDVIIDIHTPFLPLKEVSRALEQADQTACATIITQKIPYFNLMLDVVYEIFLKDNMPVVVPLYA